MWSNWSWATCPSGTTLRGYKVHSTLKIQFLICPPPTQEYDNQLESTVSEVSVAPDDDELEKTLKLAQVDMYNKGLTEREKRKR